MVIRLKLNCLGCVPGVRNILGQDGGYRIEQDFFARENIIEIIFSAEVDEKAAREILQKSPFNDKVYQEIPNDKNKLPECFNKQVADLDIVSQRSGKRGYNKSSRVNQWFGKYLSSWLLDKVGEVLFVAKIMGRSLLAIAAGIFLWVMHDCFSGHVWSCNPICLWVCSFTALGLVAYCGNHFFKEAVKSGSLLEIIRPFSVLGLGVLSMLYFPQIFIGFAYTAWLSGMLTAMLAVVRSSIEGKRNKQTFKQGWGKICLDVVWRYGYVYALFVCCVSLLGIGSAAVFSPFICFSGVFLVGGLCLVSTLDRSIAKNWFKVVNMDTTVSLSVLLVCSYALLLLLSPTLSSYAGGHMVLHVFKEALLSIGIIGCGRQLRNLHTKESDDSRPSIFGNKGIFDVLMLDHKGICNTFTREPDQVQAGDVIKLRPGDRIPFNVKVFHKCKFNGDECKGCQQGNKDYSVGGLVPALSQLLGDGPILAQVQKGIKDNEYAVRYEQAIKQSIGTKRVSQLEELLGWFIPGTLVMAFGAASMWAFTGFGFPLVINVFCSMLLCACPCVFGMAIPAVDFITQKKAKKLGIDYDNADTLRVRPKIAILDLNGTLRQPKQNGAPGKICPDTLTFLDELKKSCDHVYVLSGCTDNEDNVSAELNGKVSAENIFCNQMYHDGVVQCKKNFVEYVQCYGKAPPHDVEWTDKIVKTIAGKSKRYEVMVLGDGGNDAHAIQVADIGIVKVNSGDQRFINNGLIHKPNVVVSNLGQVTDFLSLSNIASGKIKLNLGVALGYNLIAFGLTGGLYYYLFGYFLSPSTACLMMSISSIGLLFNGWRLRLELADKFDKVCCQVKAGGYMPTSSLGKAVAGVCVKSKYGSISVPGRRKAQFAQ